MKVKQLLDLPCSFFGNTYSKPLKQIKVRALFDQSLKNEKTYPPEYDPVKSIDLDKWLSKRVKEHGKDVEYSKLKEFQVAITPSGVFGERRTYEYLLETNPLVIIDIDDITVTKKLVDSYKKYSYIIGAGESVSRKGIWILAYIDNPALIKEHFLSLKKVFTNADNLKDTTRLRYISYGYSWVRKEQETIKPYKDFIPIPIDEIYETTQLKETKEFDNEACIVEALASTGSIEESGGLHPWTIRIASKCNRKGISNAYGQKAVWNKIKSLPVVADNDRYTQERFNHDWNSLYLTYAHEHHLETKVRISKSKISRFNNRIYERSPKVLQELLATVEQDEEKEVVYFTAIILLGVLFPNRVFRYFNNNYYPNLYGYILGEAASFKGKAKIIRSAMKPYQNVIDERYKQLADQKSSDLQYNKDNKENKRPINKIPDLNLFFDGNTSSAAMLKAMQDSPVLIMFETEGDTITKTWKTDWGNYSDILRKTFEHESLYSLKKNGNEENLLRIHIQNPKLSVLVSSTEQQMRKVLNSDETENGLMSRFLFYVVQNDKKWYNGWDSNTDIDIESILSEKIPPDVWMTWNSQPDQYYSLSKEAHQYHQEYFNYVNDNWPDELFNIIALIRRSGTATARIAMVIEELRKLDNPVKKGGLTTKSYTVSGDSMLLAIDIMKILMQHLFVAWQITYKEQDFKETNVQASETRKAVTDILQSDPKMGYRKIAKKMGISVSAVAKHVKQVKNEIDLPDEDKSTSQHKTRKEVLVLMQKQIGIGYKAVARQLGIGVSTAKFHMKDIRKKLEQGASKRGL